MATIQERLRDLGDDIYRNDVADVIDALEKVAAIFLGEDARFQVAIGGNPHAIEAMLAESRAALSRARGDIPAGS